MEARAQLYLSLPHNTTHICISMYSINLRLDPSSENLQRRQSASHTRMHTVHVPQPCRPSDPHTGSSPRPAHLSPPAAPSPCACGPQTRPLCPQAALPPSRHAACTCAGPSSPLVSHRKTPQCLQAAAVAPSRQSDPDGPFHYPLTSSYRRRIEPPSCSKMTWPHESSDGRDTPALSMTTATKPEGLPS